MDYKQAIEARIAELVEQREQFKQLAEQQMAGFNMSIRELERLLTPPKEGDVSSDGNRQADRIPERA